MSRRVRRNRRSQFIVVAIVAVVVVLAWWVEQRSLNTPQYVPNEVKTPDP